jgi:hypothetical protein
MPSITTHQDATINITVKNTFLNLKRAEAPARRSNSVPRAFKLWVAQCCDVQSCGKSQQVPDSDDSTNASDQGFPDCSEQQFPDYCSECTDYCSECLDDMDFTYPAVERWSDESASDDAGKSKVTLTLDSMVTEESRTKLRAQARCFKSVRSPPDEVTNLIASAANTLSQGKDIVEVQVQDGGMGGTTMIVGTSLSANPDVQQLFSLVKDTLLNSAEQSDNTYVLGYGAKPFNTLDPLSFSANITSVPVANRSTACWDTYEKGYCRWRSECYCSHPSEADKMRVIVMIRKCS